MSQANSSHFIVFLALIQKLLFSKMAAQKACGHDNLIKAKWLPQPLQKLTWWGWVGHFFLNFYHFLYFYNTAIDSPSLEKFLGALFPAGGGGGDGV